MPFYPPSPVNGMARLFAFLSALRRRIRPLDQSKAFLFGPADDSTLPQDIIAILTQLKKDVVVSEELIRVSRLNSLSRNSPLLIFLLFSGHEDWYHGQLSAQE